MMTPMPRFVRFLRWFALLSVLSSLSACIQVDVRFEIRPDGSGQVIETYRVRDDAGWLPPGVSPLSAYLSPITLSERAVGMAPGIGASAETLPKEGRFHVARVTYDVPDFNGLVWRFGQKPLPDSLSYRFELNRRAGQPLRVDVINDPMVAGLPRLNPQDVKARKQLIATVEGMSGVQVNVQVVGAGELLKSTARWQVGDAATLFDVHADELTGQANWQDSLFNGPKQGLAACESASAPALRLDCQGRISLWLR